MVFDCVFVHYQGLPIFKQLQIEEALLRNSSQNFCLVNTNPPEAVVLGISRKPEQDLYVEHLRSDNIPIIRRYSGGGTVFLDADSLMVSWIMNSPSPMPSSKQLLQWTSTIYTPIFPSGFKVIDNDYTLFEKKNRRECSIHSETQMGSSHNVSLGYESSKACSLSSYSSDPASLSSEPFPH